jgi:hypothetical protein
LCVQFRGKHLNCILILNYYDMFDLNNADTIVPIQNPYHVKYISIFRRLHTHIVT